VDCAIATLPPLDVLVNNAGTNRPQCFLEATDDYHHDQNVRAAFFIAQAVARCHAQIMLTA